MRYPLVAALVLLVAVSGCSDTPGGGEQDPPPGEDRSTDGPLVANVIRGGQAIFPPTAEQTDPWWATLGALTVCTEGPEVTIEALRLDGDEPLQLRQYLRRGESGYQGVLGAAPDWDQPYSTLVAGNDPDGYGDDGTYDDIPGAKVTETCDETDTERGPAVVPAIKTAPGGLSARGMWVDYTTADGDRYSLRMPWQIILCGPDVDTRRC